MSGGVRVGFIGAGKMAGALARGFAKTLPAGAKAISASCPPFDASLLRPKRQNRQADTTLSFPS